MAMATAAEKRADYSKVFASEIKFEDKFQKQLREERDLIIIPEVVTVFEDTNNNGKVDIGEDKNFNGKRDKGEKDVNKNKKLDLSDKPLRQYTIYPFSGSRLAKDPTLADYMEAKGYTWVCGQIDGKKVEGFVRNDNDQVAALQKDFDGVKSMNDKQTTKMAINLRKSFDKNGTNGEALGYKPYKGFGVWRGPVDGGEPQVAKKDEKKPAKPEPKKPSSKQQVGSDEPVRDNGTIKAPDIVIDTGTDPKLTAIKMDEFKDLAPAGKIPEGVIGYGGMGARVYRPNNDPKIKLHHSDEHVQKRMQQVFLFAQKHGYEIIKSPLPGEETYYFVK